MNEVPSRILKENTRHFPLQLGNAEEENSTRAMPTVIVLVGDADRYACFIGHGVPDWVAKHGDRLTFDEARMHFVFLDQDKYR